MWTDRLLVKLIKKIQKIISSLLEKFAAIRMLPLLGMFLPAGIHRMWEGVEKFSTKARGLVW